MESITGMNLSDFEQIKSRLKSDFDDFWNINVLEDEILKENRRYIICKQNDEIVGFAGISIILDEAEIMNIVVRKDKRNQGIAHKLLQKLIEICKDERNQSFKVRSK